MNGITRIPTVVVLQVTVGTLVQLKKKGWGDEEEFQNIKNIYKVIHNKFTRKKESR